MSLDDISAIVKLLSEDLEGPTRLELARSMVDMRVTVNRELDNLERKVDVLQGRIDSLQVRLAK